MMNMAIVDMRPQWHVFNDLKDIALIQYPVFYQHSSRVFAESSLIL